MFASYCDERIAIAVHLRRIFGIALDRLAENGRRTNRDAVLVNLLAIAGNEANKPFVLVQRAVAACDVGIIYLRALSRKRSLSVFYDVVHEVRIPARSRFHFLGLLGREVMNAVNRSGVLQVQHVRVHDQVAAQLIRLYRWPVRRYLLRWNLRNAIFRQLLYHASDSALAKVREYALQHLHYRLLHVRIKNGRSHFRGLLLDLRD